MIAGLSRISVWRCAVETIEPNSFSRRFEERGRQIAQQPVGVVEFQHRVERVVDRAEQEPAHRRQVFMLRRESPARNRHRG